jgi:hypothetical protein
MRFKPLVVLTFAILSACSNEPSETDISRAVEKQIDQMNSTVKGMAGALVGGQSTAKLGDAFAYKVISLRKLGCKADGAAFVCDVEMDTEAPFVGRQKSVRPLRLVKASDGWQVTN